MRIKNIPLDAQHDDGNNDDNDCDCYITPSTNTVKETTFTTAIPTKKTKTIGNATGKTKSKTR